MLGEPRATDPSPIHDPSPDDGPAPLVRAAGRPTRRVIGSLGALLAYLDELGQAGRITAEGTGLWALFLDRDNSLLQDTGGPAPATERGLARRAVEAGAAAVILVRHRPDDDGTEPTAADIESVRRSHTALAALEVVLHDYVVVAGKRCASLRGAGLLRGTLWAGGAVREPSAQGHPV